MTEDEKTHCQFTAEQKREIAEAAQVTREDVEDVVQKYKQMQQFHEWLVMRKERGDPMPETREELMTVYKVERPKFLQPQQHKKSYCRKQLKFTVRRHFT